MTIYKDAIGGDHQAATFIVAGSDSLHPERADYVCDGTDDQVEIQAAIDALPSGGGKIILMEGNYNSGQILLPSNVIFSGVGASSVLKLNDGVNDRLIENSDRTGGNSNIVIENMYINGNKDGQTAIGPSDVYGNAGCLDFRNVTNLWVRNCTVVDAWAAGIETTLCENVIINGNRIDNSADDGIGINDQTSHALVSNNIITDAGQGKTYGAPAGIEIQDGSHHVAIIGNSIRNALADGIQISTHIGSTGCCLITISNNVIYASNTGVLINGRADSFVHDITIDNNAIDSTSSTCIYIGDHSTNTIISKNVVSDGGLYGIAIIGVNSVITNNVINNMTSYGIRVESSYNLLDGNIIKDADLGFGVFGTHNSICDNICTNTAAGTTQRYGVVLYAGGDNNKLYNNRLYNNTVANVLDVGSGNRVSSNIGFTTESSGIATLANGTTSIVVTHNLAVSPVAGDIVVTPLEAWGNMTQFYIGSYTTTTFTILGNINPGQDVDFAWKAIVL